MRKEQALPLILFIALLILPFAVKGYAVYLLYMVFLYIVLAESWNIIGGYAGQVCLGMGAFFGLGAYIAAMLSFNGFPPPLSIFIGGCTAALLGVIIFPTFRLRGVYFAIGTLFLPDIIKVIILNLEVTGGAKGFFLPLTFALDLTHWYIAALILASITVLFAFKMSNSRIGLVFKAIRDDEDASEPCGINPFKYKILAMMLASFLSGLAGGIYAHQMLFLEPHGTFKLMWSIGPVFMCIIGGVGSIIGPIIGAGIFTALSLWLVTLVGEVDLIVMGVILIVVILTMPGGIFGALSKRVKLKLS
jgi:branched-chain amino acid transport system permease protein